MKRYGLIALSVILIYITWALFNRAEAATASVTWTNPTQRTDGTTFPASAIQKTRVEWGTCNGTAFGTLIGSGENTGAGINFVTPDLPAASYCFRAFTVDTGGLTSASSVVVTKVIAPPVIQPPKPPVITTVQQVAYELRGLWPFKRMVAIGTVGLGEVCGRPWKKDGGFARLSSEQVRFGSEYRGGKLYGVCA